MMVERDVVGLLGVVGPLGNRLDFRPGQVRLGLLRTVLCRCEDRPPITCAGEELLAVRTERETEDRFRTILFRCEILLTAAGVADLDLPRAGAPRDPLRVLTDVDDVQSPQEDGHGTFGLRRRDVPFVHEAVHAEEKTRLPSAVNSARVTGWECPSSGLLEPRSFQMRTVRSCPPETIRFPSGLNATQ